MQGRVRKRVNCGEEARRGALRHPDGFDEKGSWSASLDMHMRLQAKRAAVQQRRKMRGDRRMAGVDQKCAPAGAEGRAAGGLQ
jgi:hypothetical protein